MSLQTLPLQRETLPGLPVAGYLVLLIVAILGAALVWRHRQLQSRTQTVWSWLKWPTARQPDYPPAPPIRIDQTIRAAPSTTLISARWFQENLLLAVGPNGVQLLAKSPAVATSGATDTTEK